MSKSKKVKRTKPPKDPSKAEKVTLYHFTCLMNLPAILREGITKGEVPISLASFKGPSAANLTRNPSPLATGSWGATKALTNKTKVRLTVEVRKTLVSSFAEINRAYNVPPQWVKALAPNGEGKDWFYVFSGVQPDSITKVEIEDNGEYREPEADELAALVERIAEERNRLVFRNIDNARVFVGVTHGEADSWLFDGKRENSIPVRD